MTSSVENQEMVWPTRLAEACHSRDATTQRVIELCRGFCSAAVGCPDGSHAGHPYVRCSPLPACCRDWGSGLPTSVYAMDEGLMYHLFGYQTQPLRSEVSARDDLHDNGACATGARAGSLGGAGVRPGARAYWNARTPARSSFRWTALIMSPAGAVGSVYVGGAHPTAR